MFTGISGSNTVEIASTIVGLSAAVLSGSGVNSVLVDSGTGGIASGIMGSGFMSLGRGALLPLQRRLQGVPRQARAFHSHREFSYACEHRQLAKILHRLVRRRGDD